MTYNDAAGVCLVLAVLALSAFGAGMIRPSILHMRGRRRIAVGTLLPACLLIGATGALLEVQKGAPIAAAMTTAVSLFSLLLSLVLAAAFLLGVASPSLLGLNSRRRVTEFTLYPALLLFLGAFVTIGLTTDASRAPSNTVISAAPLSEVNDASAWRQHSKREEVTRSRESRSKLSTGVQHHGETGERTPVPAIATAPTEAPTGVAPLFRAAYEVNYPSCKHFRDETLQEFDTDSEVVAAEGVSREFRSGASRQGAFAGCLDGLLGRTARFSMAGTRGS